MGNTTHSPLGLRQTIQSAIARLFARGRSVVARHGVVGAARLLAAGAADWPRERRSRMRDREFDATHGVNTAGRIALSSLDIPSESAALGIRYQATDPVAFKTSLASLGIDHRDYTFVDFGSGKGRAVLLATQFGFARIVGVEISTELTRIAKENVARWARTHDLSPTRIELVCADATDYDVGDGPLVLYFYTPFLPTLMRRVLANAAAAGDRRAPMYLVLAGDATLVPEIVAAGFRRIPGGPYRLFRLGTSPTG